MNTYSGKAAAGLLVLASVIGCKGSDMNHGSTAGVNAPEFPAYGHERWINSEPLTMEELRGKIVLVDFWEYTCVNCIRTLPYITEWHRRYADQGLVIVGVHTPEFEFGKDRANVARAVREFGIEYPVVLDNDYEIWTAYANRYWPRKYIVNPDGKIVYDHAGEGAYAETEEVIQSLIRELDPDADLPAVMEPVRAEDTTGAVCYPRTPELYCGYLRAKYGNAEVYPEETRNYTDPATHDEGRVYLSGLWRLGKERSTYEGEGLDENGYLLIPYSANEVNAVMDAAPEGETVRVHVYRDGGPLTAEDAGADVSVDADGSWIDVSVGKMYRILNAAEYGSGELSLRPTGPGLSIYAFTFGSCAVK
ncbi:MAG: redoxin domain-containing protein [Candidatus Coatesbacteria bacterium]|nr:MAG: redoxin domain-containing protein [Candidatus Coatesbacteria bacterium]